MVTIKSDLKNCDSGSEESEDRERWLEIVNEGLKWTIKTKIEEKEKESFLKILITAFTMRGNLRKNYDFKI